MTTRKRKSGEVMARRWLQVQEGQDDSRVRLQYRVRAWQIHGVRSVELCSSGQISENAMIECPWWC